MIAAPASLSPTASLLLPAGATAGRSSVSNRAPVRPFYLSRRFEAPGSLLLGNTRVKFLQEPSRRLADLLHFNLSAPSRGLAGVFDGHKQTRRKDKCPTKALKDSTR